jgi:S-adenosylmethionine decarboxylase
MAERRAEGQWIGRGANGREDRLTPQLGVSATPWEAGLSIVVVFWLETLSVALASSVALLGMLYVCRSGAPNAGPRGSSILPPSELKAAIDEDDCDPDDAEEERQFEFSGRHLLASYSACDPAAIRDLKGLTAAFHAAVRASGATLLHAVEHSFAPYGMTAVAVLSESHASIHTYPEHESCFVDIFTCGTTCSVEAFDSALRKFLRPKTHSRRIICRHEEMIDESPEGAGAAA